METDFDIENGLKEFDKALKELKHHFAKYMASAEIKGINLADAFQTYMATLPVFQSDIIKTMSMKIKPNYREEFLENSRHSSVGSLMYSVEMLFTQKSFDRLVKEHKQVTADVDTLYATHFGEN